MIRSAKAHIHNILIVGSLILIKFAVRCMPKDAASLRDAVAGALREQAAYEYYAAYTRLCGCKPWPFEMWRQRAERLARIECPGRAAVQL